MFDVRKNPRSLVPRNSSQPCFPAGVPPLKAAGWRSSSDAHRGLLSEMALNGPCGVLSDSRPEVFKFKLCKHWVFVQVKLSCGPPICDLWSQVCFFSPQLHSKFFKQGVVFNLTRVPDTFERLAKTMAAIPRKLHLCRCKHRP